LVGDKIPAIVIHAIPLPGPIVGSALDAVQRIAENEQLMAPAPGRHYLVGALQYEFDGCRTVAGNDENPAYTEVFRSGAIEGYYSLPTHHETGSPQLHPGQEVRVLESVRRYADLVQRLGLGLPMFVGVSYTNVRGAILVEPSGHGGSAHYERGPLHQQQLELPFVIIESVAADLPRIMKPTFDMVWNAFGQPRSANYDASGRWSAGAATHV
jgi:hypothetical protein